jgi:hypothetical protein
VANQEHLTRNRKANAHEPKIRAPAQENIEVADGDASAPAKDARHKYILINKIDGKSQLRGTSVDNAGLAFKNGDEQRGTIYCDMNAGGRQIVQIEIWREPDPAGVMPGSTR